MAPTSSPSPLFGPLVSPVLDDEQPASGLGERPTAKAPAKDVTLLPVVSELPRTYICPGEKHPIPRSIHLARLAAFFPSCRLCEHRTDTGQLPRSMVGRIEQTAQRGKHVSHFRTDGVRGAYLNQLTRKTAGQIAAAVAERLWRQQPLVGRPQSTDDDEERPTPPRRRVGPTVVIGQDARPSSPDLLVGVSESLRRMGCEVVDVGRVSRPCFAFAVDHLQASGGLFVTGSGCAESWTGIDIVGAGGIPWSMNGTLAAVEQGFNSGVSRPTRQGGSQRYFDATVPYRASLLKHYQSVRAQKIACYCEDATIVETLRALLEPLPCEVVWIDDAALTSSGRLAALKTESTDSALIINDEGTAIQLFDHEGRPIPEHDLLDRILTTASCSPAKLLSTEDPDHGSESIARRMQEQQAMIGYQPGGRLWYRDSFPRCDAAITLGHLLQTPPSPP